MARQEETIPITQVKADLRAFGAIGFQNLWLRKQGYHKGKILLERLADAAIDKGIDIMGLTSEDDKMLPGHPEDRFGFLRYSWSPLGYEIEPAGEGILRVLRTERGKEGMVYIVNCETRHQNRELGQDWAGLKLHVVGGNRLPKELDLEDAVSDANDKGYMTFLMNVSTPEAQELADTVIEQCTGVVGHDANNTFAGWTTRIPLLGRQFANYQRKKNLLAVAYAVQRKKPSIVVSSAHWIHEIGKAGIEFTTPEEDVFSLDDLRDIIESKNFKSIKGYNNPLDVLRFAHLLRKYGSKPDRFKGMESSYNEPQTQ